MFFLLYYIRMLIDKTIYIASMFACEIKDRMVENTINKNVKCIVL